VKQIRRFMIRELYSPVLFELPLSRYHPITGLVQKTPPCYREDMSNSPHTAALNQNKPLIGVTTERCIYCRGLRITREGRRYKQHETIQLWRCHDCDRVFTPQITKGKTFPLAVILEALTRYYRGDTRMRVATHIKERFGLTLSPRTLSQWLAEYRLLTTYARLRARAGRCWG
jgi:hypothetical protein